MSASCGPVDQKEFKIQDIKASTSIEEREDDDFTTSVFDKVSTGSIYTTIPTDSVRSNISSDESSCEKSGFINQYNSCKQEMQIVFSNEQFNFVPKALPILRDIDRNVNLEEMTNVKFVCPGSNSHIFSATWRNQNVIVKVKY